MKALIKSNFSEDSHYCKNLIAYWSRLSPSRGFTLKQYPHLALLKAPTTMLWAHYVWGEVSTDAIHIAQGFFDDLPFIWLLDPQDNLASSYIRQHGLSLLGQFPELIYSIDGKLQSGKNSNDLQVKIIQTREEFHQWITSVATVYSMDWNAMYNFFNPVIVYNDPHFRFCLVYNNSRILGAGLAHHANETLGLYCVTATEKEHFTDVGYALLSHYNNWGYNLNASWLTVQTFPEYAEKLYEPFGFILYQPFAAYSLAP